MRDGEEPRAAPLWAAPGSMSFPHVEDTPTDSRAPLNVADEEASYAPVGGTPEHCASADKRALACAKGPVSPGGMTPVIIASACSR